MDVGDGYTIDGMEALTGLLSTPINSVFDHDVVFALSCQSCFDRPPTPQVQSTRLLFTAEGQLIGLSLDIITIISRDIIMNGDSSMQPYFLCII